MSSLPYWHSGVVLALSVINAVVGYWFGCIRSARRSRRLARTDT